MIFDSAARFASSRSFARSVLTSITVRLFPGFLLSLLIVAAPAAYAQNTEPTADPQSVSTQEDVPLVITLTGSDPEGASLTYAITRPPSNGSLGSVIPQPDGSADVTYTPDPNFNTSGSPPDSFEFTVNDGALTSLPATVSITVQAQPDAPTVTITSPPDGSSFASNTAINFVGTATDVEDGTLTASINWSSNLDGSLGTGGSISISTLSQGTHVITASVTDSQSEQGSATISVTITNTAPTATNVSIAGTPQVGQTLTGNYTYNDAEDDPEGTSTFRWLRDGTRIPNAISRTYVVGSADKERTLQFEVTPVAQTGVLTGDPVLSGGLLISNTAPSITGQNPVEIQEDTSREIVLADLIVTDLDDNNCLTTADCTLSVLDGANYTRVDNTITPVLNFDQTLTVPVTVNDGTADSGVFNLSVTVTPVNDAPAFIGVLPPGLSTPEDTTLTIPVSALDISDPDNVPADFVLTLDPVLPPDANYILAGPASITPAENFNGDLAVRRMTCQCWRQRLGRRPRSKIRSLR
jgi:hypothetical protein